MKKFIVINGQKVYIINKETKEDALIFAQNYMDHSSEVILREIKDITDYTRTFNNLNIQELREEAEELINGGNSGEKMEGYGMKYILDLL